MSQRCVVILLRYFSSDLMLPKTPLPCISIYKPADIYVQDIKTLTIEHKKGKTNNIIAFRKSERVHTYSLIKRL